MMPSQARARQQCLARSCVARPNSALTAAFEPAYASLRLPPLDYKRAFILLMKHVASVISWVRVARSVTIAEWLKHVLPVKSLLSNHLRVQVTHCKVLDKAHCQLDPDVHRRHVFLRRFMPFEAFVEMFPVRKACSGQMGVVANAKQSREETRSVVY